MLEYLSVYAGKQRSERFGALLSATGRFA